MPLSNRSIRPLPGGDDFDRFGLEDGFIISLGGSIVITLAGFNSLPCIPLDGVVKEYFRIIKEKPPAGYENTRREPGEPAGGEKSLTEDILTVKVVDKVAPVLFTVVPTGHEGPYTPEDFAAATESGRGDFEGDMFAAETGGRAGSTPW